MSLNRLVPPSDLADLIRTIPDYPKPGIQFRDITTLLRDGPGLRAAVERLADRYRVEPGSAAETEQHAPVVDVVVGIEARGFIFGPAVALELGAGFVPLRKPGKLPGETIGRDFELEYGQDRLELHVGSIEPGQRVLLVDDLIATGGTAMAGVELIRALGADVAAADFVVALPDLGGITRLEAAGCPVHWLCEFGGE